MKTKIFITLFISILCCLNSLTAQTTLTLNSTDHSACLIENTGYSWDWGATIFPAIEPYTITGSGDILILGLSTTMANIAVTTQNLTTKNTAYETALYLCAPTSADIVLKGKNTFQSVMSGIGSGNPMKHITLSGDTVYALADSTASAAYYSNGVFGIGYPGIISDSLVINSGYVFALGKTGISGFKNVIINDGVITAIGKKADYGIKANKIIINGGSVKAARLNTQAVNSKGENVYCVTLPHNGQLSVVMNNGKDTTLNFQAHHEGDANFYIYLPNGSYTFTCGSKTYKATVAGSVVTAQEITVPAVAGQQSYDVSSLGFANADILSMISADLSDTTSAVIANGIIEFYAPAATTYSVVKKSTVITSLKTSIYPGTQTVGVGGCNLTGYYKGKPKYYGNANEPITALTHFVGVGTKASGDVSSSWKAQNTFIGYDQYATATIPGGPCWILAEDRNETTGKLLASLYFDPSIGVPGAESLKGPHVFNVIFNPTDEVISTALAAHSVYKTSTALQASALDSVKTVRDASNSMIMANVQFMRAFTTQAKTYTFDISTISGGKFEAGDTLVLKYLLGSYDATVYHSGVSASTTALEAIAQSKVDTSFVDSNGYISFNVYGGGFFSLTKISSITTDLKEGLLSNSATIYPNPFIDVLNISASGIEVKSLKITDITGRTVLNRVSNLNSVDLGNLPQGVYLVQLTTDKGVITKQAIKNK
jgi:hypothetical protein